eukprot:scaffold364679_cov28-Prasinocladus_malaysianus.AAC.1
MAKWYLDLQLLLLLSLNELKIWFQKSQLSDYFAIGRVFVGKLMGLCGWDLSVMACSWQAVQHMQNRTLAGAWLRWEDFVKEVREQRRSVNKAVGYWSNHRLGPGFLAWIRWT